MSKRLSPTTPKNAAPQEAENRKEVDMEVSPSPAAAAPFATLRPSALYVWLVPSEHVQEQPGSWRIRKWDTEPFPEANFTVSAVRYIDRSEAVNIARNRLTDNCPVTELGIDVLAKAVMAMDEHIAEPCHRLGCRFDVAQNMLHRAQERGELTETEVKSVSSSIRATLLERAACAKAMCTHCRDGKYPEFQSDPEPNYWHDATQCRAASIWLRGKSTDVLGLYLEEKAPASANKATGE